MKMETNTRYWIKRLVMSVSLFHLFTFSPLLLSGCIDEFEADIPSEDSDMLVVEGTICSGKQNTFILSRTLPVHPKEEDYYKDIAYYAYSSYVSPYATMTHQMVEGAIVSVRGSDGSEYKAEETYAQSIGYSTAYATGNILGYTPRTRVLGCVTRLPCQRKRWSS